MKLERIYLDIETIDIDPRAKDTFDPTNHRLTLCGLLYEYDDGHTELLQLVFTPENFDHSRLQFYEVIEKAKINNPEIKIVGYNILRFDIPVLYYNIGFNPPLMMLEDLMFECWRCDLRGGLKNVCKQLNIARPHNTQGDGLTAKFLWCYYVEQQNTKCLDDLMKYNADDLYVLLELRRKLLERIQKR